MFKFDIERVTFKGVICEVEGFYEVACYTIFKVRVVCIDLFYVRLAVDEFKLAYIIYVYLCGVKAEP